jgi:mannose-6-phosphate isomerase-like protein (cupin superfamily)
MRKLILGSVGLIVVLSASSSLMLSQGGMPPTKATYVTAENIQTHLDTPGVLETINHVDMGGSNVGIAALRRGATKAGAPLTGINHTKVTEVYYIVSGSGTLVTGTDVTDVKPLAADNTLVKQVVGPSNNATFKPGAQMKVVKTGDFIIIPRGVYHGFTDISDHITYVTVRQDANQVVPAGYLSPELK